MPDYSNPQTYLREKIAKQRYAAQTRRGIEWSLNSSALEQQALDYPYCAITGEPLVFEPNYVYSASIDRVNSELGYVEGNVQWVGSSVNMAKNVLDHEQFVSLCQSVVRNSAQPRWQDQRQLTLFDHWDAF